LLSILHYVIGGVAALCACIPIVHLIIGLVIVIAPDKLGIKGDSMKGNGSPELVGWFFMTIAVVMIVLGWIFAGLLLATARFLAKRKYYTFCFVIAFVECLFIPLGTALGIFTIIVLMRPAVKHVFVPPQPSPVNR
jgi:hypothetical protein